MKNDLPTLDRLFQSASSDAPAPGAKARAMASVARVATIPSGTAAWRSVAGWTLAAVAVGGGMAAHERWSPRAGSPVVSVRSVAPPAEAPSDRRPVTGSSIPSLPSALSPAPSSTEDNCSAVSLPDAPPTVCSTNGEPLLLEIVNTCSTEAVDLYWVTFFCEERLFRELAPGETFYQRTYDTHPWRIRDHVTHRLLKEVAPSGTPSAAWGPVLHAEEQNRHVVISPLDEGDQATSRCSERGGEAEVLELLNTRSEPADLYHIDSQCTEVLFTQLKPGEDLRRPSSSGDAWRVRDSATHRLLKEIRPMLPPSKGVESLRAAGGGDLEHAKTVVVSAADEATASTAQCSEAGESIELTVVNERSRPVELLWVDYECGEVPKAHIEPGGRWTHPSTDAFRWRVRDAETHALLKEFAPNPNPGALRLFVSVP